MKGIIVTALLEMEEQDYRFEILKGFGHDLGNTFHTNCGSFFANVDHPFRLLEEVDGDLNKDVQKIFPDAKRPSFQSKILWSNGMVMLYVSKRCSEYFPLGMMEASFKHFFIDSSNEMIEQSDGSELFRILEK